MAGSPKPLTLYMQLPRTNCRKCGMASCMAFAHALGTGDKLPTDCPDLDAGAAGRMAEALGQRPADEGFAAPIRAMRQRMVRVDLKAEAARLGATYREGALVIACLGREFAIDNQGTIRSRCHVNPWMQTLLLTYCLSGGTGEPDGQWAAFGELPGCAGAAPYFARRFERPLTAMAEEHADVIPHLLGLFGGVPMEGFDASHAFMLRPLPRVPLLVLFWEPDAEFPARVTAMLDRSAPTYLGPEVLTFMGRGMVEMFQKILLKHDGISEDLLSL